MKLRGVVLVSVAAGAVLMTGCSSGSKAVKATPTTTAAVVTTKATPAAPKTYAGENAAHLATLVGCTGVKPLDTTNMQLPGVTSFVECTYQGYTAWFSSFKTVDEAVSAMTGDLLVAGAAWYATGPAWDAYLVGSKDATGDKMFAKAVVAKLGGAVITGG